MPNESNALNQAVFMALNAGTNTPPGLIDAGIIAAEYLILLLPILLLALWFWGGAARRAVAFKAFTVAVVALGVNLLIGSLWPQPRPFMLGVGHTWVAHAADASFPSDHMTVFMSIGLTLLLAVGTRALGVLVLLGALAVAWARVFLGVHFPLDMLGSVGVAAGSYVLITGVWRWIGDPLLAFAQRVYRWLLAWPIQRGWLPR